MIRLTINHINMFGPLVFPAKQAQIFVQDAAVPHEQRKAFYQAQVDKWLKEHPDRQRFGEWVKDIVGNDAITDPSKVYGAHEDLKGPEMEDL